MFAIMDMGYVGCFFSSIRLMISTLEANTYLEMQKNQKKWGGFLCLLEILRDLKQF